MNLPAKREIMTRCERPFLAGRRKRGGPRRPSSAPPQLRPPLLCYVFSSTPTLKRKALSGVGSEKTRRALLHQEPAKPGGQPGGARVCGDRPACGAGRGRRPREAGARGG